MKIDKEKIKSEFLASNYTLLITNGKENFESTECGIAPLFSLAENKTDLTGFFACDKIVGRAAAFLYLTLGVSEVFSLVMSEGAIKIFEENNVKASYLESPEKIINRKGDDICPMDKAVLDVTDKDEALKKIKDKIKSMR